MSRLFVAIDNYDNVFKLSGRFDVNLTGGDDTDPVVEVELFFIEKIEDDKVRESLIDLRDQVIMEGVPA